MAEPQTLEPDPVSTGEVSPWLSSSLTPARLLAGAPGAAAPPGGRHGGLDRLDDKPEGSKDVVLVTHDSFVLPSRWSHSSSDSPATTSSHPPATAHLTTKLVLTEGNPTGDGSRRRQHVREQSPRRERVLRPTCGHAGARQYAVPGDEGGWRRSTTATSASTSTGWFADHHLAPPRSSTPREAAYDGLIAVSAPPPARPGSPSCSAPSASTATAGRRGGRSSSPTAPPSPTADPGLARPTSRKAAAKATTIVVSYDLHRPSPSPRQ